MQVTIVKDIPDKRIADLLCSAFEAGNYGSMYWIHDYKARGVLGDPWGDGSTYPYVCAPFGDGLYITLEPDAPDAEEDEVGKTYLLDRPMLEKGLVAFAQKYPKQFGDFLEENDDAETADLFLQCCLFGGAIYG